MKSVETDLVGNRVEIQRTNRSYGNSSEVYKYKETSGRVRVVTLEHDCLILYIETETIEDAFTNQSEIGDVIRRPIDDGGGVLTIKIKK